MDVTVLICTYNRQRLLGSTLDSLAAMRVPAGIRWDVLVVDNNSTDGTRAEVERRVPGFPVPLCCLFERRQGKAHALNTGIAASTAAVVAFTDDDVCVAPDWLGQAVRPLIERSDIDYTGGPVLPAWQVPPPRWISGNPGVFRGPIALLDYGTETFIFEERRRIAMGVNMAVRRELIDRVGGFHPGLERKGPSLMGQGQAEFFFRTRRAGARGLYVPGMRLRHHVPGARLTRQYYRRWWYWKGVARARMQEMHPVLENGLDLRLVPRLAGLPRFVWGDALRDVLVWLRAALTGNVVIRTEREMMLAYFAGYFMDRIQRGRRVDDDREAGAVDVTRPRGDTTVA
jgi:glycosyltransferase involved in cell wall biosynthesis